MKKKYILLLIIILLVISGSFLVFKNSSGNNNSVAHLQKKFINDFNKSDFDGRRKIIEKYYGALTAEEILDALEKKIPDCHDQAHELGKIIYKDTGSISESSKICGNRCTSACFHGTLMEAFKNVATEKNEEHGHPQGTDDHMHIDLDDLKDKFNTFCDQQEVLDVHRENSCVHGLGHVMHFLSNYTIDQSIKLCDVFTDKWAKLYCLSGIFMERDIGLDNGIKQNEAPTDNILYPCDTYDEFPVSCYSFRINQLYNAGLENTYELCNGLTGAHRLGCIYGWGLNFHQRILSDPKIITEVCNFTDSEDMFSCIEGVIARASYIDENQTKKACEYLNSEEKNHCLLVATEKLYSSNLPIEQYFNQDYSQ